MPDTHNTKNFFAHGGGELVIGGKLTFLEDAEVEGFENTLPKLENIPASTATTVAALKEEFNTLIASLKEAGYMEADEEPDDGEGDEDDDDDENGGGSGDQGGGA